MLGVVLVTIGQLFHACHCIFEEHILQEAEGQEPCYMQGWEGVFGMLFSGVIYVIAHFIGCPLEGDHCTNGKIDDIGEAFDQLNNHRHMYAFLFLFMISGASQSGFGSFLIKHTSAASRTVAEQLKVFFVWMFFMAYTGPGHEEFQIEKLVGFVLVILGVLFFEEILAFEGYRIVYRDEEEEDKKEEDEAPAEGAKVEEAEVEQKNNKDQQKQVL